MKIKTLQKLALVLLLGTSTLQLSAKSGYTGYEDDNSYQPTASANIYENGFFHGINCVERELALQGTGGDAIYFKPYLVVMNISSMPKERILIYKNYGYEEGLIPVTVNTGEIVFKSFERKADARYLAENILNTKYFRGKHKAMVVENKHPDGYRRADYIYRDLFRKMRESIERSIQGKIFITDGSYKKAKSYHFSDTPKKRKTKKRRIVKPKKKRFKRKKPQDKNFSSSYMYPENKKTVKVKKKSLKPKKMFSVNGAKAEVFTNKNGKMHKIGYVISGEPHTFDSIYTEKDGTKYVKTKKGYVELDDVTIIKK